MEISQLKKNHWNTSSSKAQAQGQTLKPPTPRLNERGTAPSREARPVQVKWEGGQPGKPDVVGIVVDWQFQILRSQDLVSFPQFIDCLMKLLQETGV